MIIRDLDKKVINNEIYWSFDDVYSSTKKLKDMLISEITEEKKEGITNAITILLMYFGVLVLMVFKST